MDDRFEHATKAPRLEFDKWVIEDEVMYKLASSANKSDRLHAFDMDGCLIVPKDPKKVMSKTDDDWNLVAEVTRVCISMKSYPSLSTVTAF